MADNVTYDRQNWGAVPNQTSIAADEIAGVQHQRIKMQFGEDGTATDVSAVNPFPTQPVPSSSDGTRGPFGRLLIADKGKRFDVEFIYDEQPHLIDSTSNTSGGATVTHNSDSRDLTLDIVNATEATEARSPSYLYIPYTPGDGQSIHITGTMDSASLGTGSAEVFLRTSVTGSTVDTNLVTQANWTTNTTGINWDTSQIFVIGFQSLKVGTILFGMVSGGAYTQVATIDNDNLTTGGYWQSPSLPLLWRIYNTATETIVEIGYGDELNAVGFRYRMPVNASATMRAICGTVHSEGGQRFEDLPGFEFAQRQPTAITVSTTIVPIISIRPKLTFNSLLNRGVIIPDSVSAYASSQAIELLVYAYDDDTKLTGDVWVSNDVHSIAEYDVTATAINTTGIDLIAVIYVPGNNRGSSAGTLLGKEVLTLDSAGLVGKILTVAAVRAGGTNATAKAAIKWKEIR